MNRPLRLAARLTAAIALGFGLSGCAMHAVHHQEETSYQSADQHVSGLLQKAHHPDQRFLSGPIVSHLPYVSTDAVPYHAPYPPVFDLSVSVTEPSGGTITDILTKLSGTSGVRMTAAPEVLRDPAGDGNKPGSTSQAASSGNKDDLQLPAALLGGVGASAGPDTFASAFAYTGTLRGALDALAQRLSATWKYDASTNAVRIYRLETRRFALATTIGSSTINASMGGAQNTISGQQGRTLKVAGGQAGVTSKANIDISKDVADTVKSMLSEQGSMHLAPGAITVTDVYSNVDRIANYIHQVNTSLRLAVAVHVSVYQVQVKNSANHGLDWNVLYNTLGRLADRVGVAIGTPNTPIQGADQLIINAPSQNANGDANLFANSSLMLQALTTLGHTSVVQNVTQMTTNNVPARIDATISQAYLAETTPMLTTGTSSSTGVVGTGATLTPGNVQTGFQMQILPSIQADGRHVLLSMNTTISQLTSMQTASSGGASIQLPSVASNSDSQRAWLKSGQTLVVAAFDSTNNSNTTNTLFGAKTWGFGGNREVGHARSAVIFVITPIVSDAYAGDDATTTY